VCLLRLRLLGLNENVELVFDSVDVSSKVKAKVIYLVFEVVGCLNDRTCSSRLVALTNKLNFDCGTNFIGVLL
jgi:hypothetical protein